jgi:ATP-dependent exoDNAse (exonuclease V) beta subunit
VSGAAFSLSAEFEKLKTMRDSSEKKTWRMTLKPQNSLAPPLPPDQIQRIAALDPQRSILVQAPAGSGKTDLLTRRFLRLLADVDDPKHIVAITFTRAAAAEMRHRILAKLEEAASRDPSTADPNDVSMEALADRALAHSRQLGWQLLDLSSQLRISTIDSFCRELAQQQPIHSGIGSNLQISERPTELYRSAARSTLQRLGDPRSTELSGAIRDLLLWRDNNWKELEDLLVKMLSQRDRWMHAFVLMPAPDWTALRIQLEKPFANAAAKAINALDSLLAQFPDLCGEAHRLVQFGCKQSGGILYRELAELADFPCGPFTQIPEIEVARDAYLCLAKLILTAQGKIRQRIDKSIGFPPDRKLEKQQLQNLIARLSAVEGFESALASICDLPPVRYTDEDWQIVRSSFILLRHAGGELKAAFAEAGTVDFVEVAQIARQILRNPEQQPTDAAIDIADDIRHLLVDEFQDTSRRQHEFISALISAWPDRAGRSIFVVGDPVQSIYSFRDAEAELFGRVQERGFEFSEDESFILDPVRLTANFRTDPRLVSTMNEAFEKVFAQPDGSGIEFTQAEAARDASQTLAKHFELHLAFLPQSMAKTSLGSNANLAAEEITSPREASRAEQLAEIVALIRTHLQRIQAARDAGKKYRIAVLGRARTALAPIAAALREAAIPFRAVELENLQDRPEILDAVALARAMANPQDRVAWLGVLRAPWCGLSLVELHAIAGNEEPPETTATILQLLSQRLDRLSPDSRNAARRVLAAFASVPHLRNTLPTATVGTLLQQLWRSLGGDRCVDDSARANLDLFWKRLDKLPAGELDLNGPALEAALAELFSLPDPAAGSDCGVQLMTIHKSKGLEFEVVIVPDLQARSGSSKPELLSWLERGIAEPDESGDLTEFLVAPLQFKGSDRGQAKRWVDNARRERELQETRRILYVAATRAREELHIFAQPAYKIEDDGSRVLLDPRNSLLATAWPALEEEIKTRFDQSVPPVREETEPGELVSVAAGANNIVVLPRPTVLRRLPPDVEAATTIDAGRSPSASVVGLGDTYQRHEGGIFSRSLGDAVHQLLEELARLRSSLDWTSALEALEKFRPRITAMVRSAGITLAHAEDIASQAFNIARAASCDPFGQWILSPHFEAVSESGWAGIVGGSLRLVRVDRLFRAGLEPLQSGDDGLWIIDYKTAHVENLDAKSALSAFRATYEPQLQTYASLLRNLYGPAVKLRAGLYFPRMSLFDWWEI